MKRIMFFALLLIIVLVVNNGCDKERETLRDVVTDTNTWYYLCPDHKFVDEFRLNAGESKIEIVKSEKELWVGFGTDSPQGLIPKYASMSPFMVKYPILMYQQGTGVACSNRIGEGLVFTPVKGKIQLVVTNRSLEQFRIYIFSIPSITNKCTYPIFLPGSQHS